MSELKTPRKRALRESVVAARKGRAAIAPISARLIQWHERAAKLHGKLNHLQLRGVNPEPLIEDLDVLAGEVQEATADWRAELHIQDETGRVSDVERAVAGIADRLSSMRTQILRLQ